METDVKVGPKSQITPLQILNQAAYPIRINFLFCKLTRTHTNRDQHLRQA